jgi:sensor histidine kinase YesM
MLLNFTALLRTSLTRTRRPTVTLGEECDLLRAYLEIAAIRMGARLVWRIDAEPATLAASLPPLLVQPLVENALRHGIEPKPEGGTLTIRSYLADSALIVEVANTGCTFPLNAPEGVGLANVRERLHACYGQRASLELEAGEGGGLTARIRLPYELHEPTPGHR